MVTPSVIVIWSALNAYVEAYHQAIRAQTWTTFMLLLPHSHTFRHQSNGFTDVPKKIL